jgi:dolichol-phosphate mannosyltransferase
MAFDQPILTVIVPVFNEAGTIAETLDAVFGTSYTKQIIVIDDGSTDGSAEAIDNWLRRVGAPRNVCLCRHSVNCGKGTAIRTGLVRCEGEIVIVQDADLECDPSDYPALVEPILNGSVDVVLGSRFLGSGTQHPWNTGRLFVCIANALVWVLYGRRISDEAGCYKVMRSQVLRNLDLRCTRFEFCPEVVAKICRMGLVIKEVPVRYRRRTRRDGKKIGLRDAAKAILTLLWWRFARIPGHGLGHRCDLPPVDLKSWPQ